MAQSRGRLLRAAGTALILTGCSETEVPAVACEHQPGAYFSDPAAAGAWSVGFQRWEFEYDVLPDLPARTIALNVWYPTMAESGPAGRYHDRIQDPLVIAEAPPATPADGCRHPVIVYSHGHLGWAGTGAHLLRHMASQGWVAVAPDHYGNTLWTEISPRPTALYIHRPRDLSAVLDAMAALPEASPLAGRLALDRVIAAGHSFGAYSAWAVAGADYDSARLDSRCADPEALPTGCSPTEKEALAAGFADPRVVGIMTSGGVVSRDWHGDEGHRAVTIPVLDMSGTEDPAYPRSLERWPDLAGLDVTWLILEGGCHASFEWETFGCDTLEVDAAYDWINTYSSAFAQAVLLGRSDAGTDGLLSGTESLSDRLQVERSLP